MKTEKKNYQSPELQLIYFEKQDLLITSGEGENGVDIETEFDIRP